MKQVDKNHYRFEKYSFEGRWISYYHQLREVLLIDTTSILEIGVGDFVFQEYIKHNTSIDYKSLDIAEDLHPDILGSVSNIPLEKNTVDICCAFEVLEHIPFDQFESAIREMTRVAQKAVVMSLPHYGPTLSLSLRFPLLRNWRMQWKLPFPKKHTFDGEHYWEIGKRSYPLSKIKSIMQKYAIVEKHFIPFGSPYHHFFVLTPLET